MTTSFLPGLKKKPPPPGNPRLRLSWLKDPEVLKLFLPMSVSRKEIRRLSQLGERCETISVLFGQPLSLTSPFWYLHGLKEIFVDETYRFPATSASPCILDCGANIGLSIIYFLRRFPSARIVAFEPDEDIFRLLKKNTAGLPGTLSLVRKAVWISEGVHGFSGDQSVGGTLTTSAEDNGDVAIKPVGTVRLRDYLTQPIDLLKIDIEGAEFDVLKDCRDKLEWVQHLFIEYHSLPEKPQQLAALLSILTGAGFRYYVKEAWENMTHPFIEKQGIFYDLQLNIFAYRNGPGQESSQRQSLTIT